MRKVLFIIAHIQVAICLINAVLGAVLGDWDAVWAYLSMAFWVVMFISASRERVS